MDDKLNSFIYEWQHCDTSYYSKPDEGNVFDEFTIESIKYLPLQTEQDIQLVKDTWNVEFYKDIDHLIYYQTGQRDGAPWEALGMFKNGFYFFLYAWCDFTGFGCQDGKSIYVSRDLQQIQNHAIDYNQRARAGIVEKVEKDIDWLPYT